MRAGLNKSLLDKVEMLFNRAGLPEVVQAGDLGAKPFLTDANTLYLGGQPRQRG